MSYDLGLSTKEPTKPRPEWLTWGMTMATHASLSRSGMGDEL